MEPRGDLIAVGQALRRARERRGWAQERLAAEAGLTARTVMNTELGRHGASVDTLFDLAAALGVALSDLIAEAELDRDE